MAEAPLNVLVTGGRNFADGFAVMRALDQIKEQHGIKGVVQGGADDFGAQWARQHEAYNVPINALWDDWGRAAGPMRNSYMLELCRIDLVVAFPGGTGTQDMLDKAAKAGVKTWQPAS